jgi:hypothetical protein
MARKGVIMYQGFYITLDFGSDEPLIMSLTEMRKLLAQEAEEMLLWIYDTMGVELPSRIRLREEALIGSD